MLAYDDSPIEHDGHLVASPSEDERPDAKMLKSVHGEIPKQSAPIPKEELEESARKSILEASENSLGLVFHSIDFRLVFAYSFP